MLLKERLGFSKILYDDWFKRQVIEQKNPQFSQLISIIFTTAFQKRVRKSEEEEFQLFFEKYERILYRLQRPR